MNKVLTAGFKGKFNSSKIILDNIDTECKLYLENDFDECARQIISCIGNHKFVFAFGQKPVIKSIYIETAANFKGKKIFTGFDYKQLSNFLKEKGYKVKISEDAGNYLCNHVYASGLDFIERNGLETLFLFVHVPTVKNINSLFFAKVFSEFLCKFH